MPSFSLFWSLRTELTLAEPAFLVELHPGGRLHLSRKIFCLFYRKCHKMTVIMTEMVETPKEVQITFQGSWFGGGRDE